MADQHSNNGLYPRPLTPREREWLEWILPVNRSAYQLYRNALDTLVVIGQGRRGKGELILGHAGEQPDFSEPLPPVAAYGAIETTTGTISITLREILNQQISVEIVCQQSDDIPEKIEELRRWTYSTWEDGNFCPQCLHGVRTFSMRTSETDYFVLAFCTFDKRIWVYDSATKMNRLIPVTNFYNELMLHKNIRDPKIALDSKRLFSELSRFSDSDLTYAFFTYNKIKTKVHIEGEIKTDFRRQRGVKNILRKIFSV